MSILPASDGTQNEWITSGLASCSSTRWPTGRRSSLAVSIGPVRRQVLDAPPPLLRRDVNRDTTVVAAAASTVGSMGRPYAINAPSTTVGSATPPPMMRRFAARWLCDSPHADRVDRDRHDGRPDDQRADGHDVEQLGDLLGVAAGGDQRRLRTAAGGESRRRRSPEYAESCGSHGRPQA